VEEVGHDVVGNAPMPMVVICTFPEPGRGPRPAREAGNIEVACWHVGHWPLSDVFKKEVRFLVRQDQFAGCSGLLTDKPQPGLATQIHMVKRCHHGLKTRALNPNCDRTASCLAAHSFPRADRLGMIVTNPIIQRHGQGSCRLQPQTSLAVTSWWFALLLWLVLLCQGHLGT